MESKSYLPSIGLEIYNNLTVGDLERRRFKAGEFITKEGMDAHGEAYVIHSGVVEIRRMFDGEHRLLGSQREGELIGDLALFRQAPRSTDMIAQTDVELLVLKNERLDWLIRNRPQVAIEVICAAGGAGRCLEMGVMSPTVLHRLGGATKSMVCLSFRR